MLIRVGLLDYFVIIDKVMVTTQTHLLTLECVTTVGFNTVSTAPSFSFNLYENPVSNCALIV